MAWAERLPSGRWRGGWRTPDGGKRYTTRATHPEHPYARKRDALEAAQEAEVAARRQAAAHTGTLSASIMWGEWWDHIRPERPHSDTAASEASAVKLYLTPRWGDVPLHAIEQRDIKAWLADMLAAHSAGYVRRIYAVLRRSIALAIEEEVLTASPCAGIRVPRPPRRAKAYADDTYRAAIGPHLPRCHRDLMDLGVETGLRPGELCALHADQVDLAGGWLVVSRALVAEQRRIREWPKDRDARTVPLTDRAAAIIGRLLAGRDLAAGCGYEHIGVRCGSVLVVRHSRGGLITPKLWRSAIVRAAGQAGVPVRGRGPYSVRRAFASRAARGGLDPFRLAELMGHEDVELTTQYVQQTPGARDELRAALGERTGLTVVEGQSGASRGADPDSQAPHDTTIRREAKGR